MWNWDYDKKIVFMDWIFEFKHGLYHDAWMYTDDKKWTLKNVMEIYVTQDYKVLMRTRDGKVYKFYYGDFDLDSPEIIELDHNEAFEKIGNLEDTFGFLIQREC